MLGDPRGAKRSGTLELPAPDLGDLVDLVAGLRDGGLPVWLRVDVEPDDVPAAVSRLAYRIIQEGTTNVLRHSGCVPTTGQIQRTRDRIVVGVHNTAGGGTGAGPGPGGGRGLVGLRERAVALGGRLTTRLDPDGGFHLEGVFPLGRAHG